MSATAQGHSDSSPCRGMTFPDIFSGKDHGESCSQQLKGQKFRAAGQHHVCIAQLVYGMGMGMHNAFGGLGTLDEGPCNRQTLSRRPELTVQSHMQCLCLSCCLLRRKEEKDISKAPAGKKARGNASGEGSPWQPAMQGLKVES